MKRFFLGIIFGVILTSSVAMAVSYIAEPASFKVMVNGKEFVSEPPAMVIDGSTYLPLRAMGNALGVPVEWNAELGQAEVGGTTAKGFVAYSEKDWCPDFGKFVGVTHHTDYTADDGAHIYVYNATGIKTNDLYEYAKILTNNGFIMVEIDDGIGLISNDKSKRMGIGYISGGKEIMVMVW